MQSADSRAGFRLGDWLVEPDLGRVSRARVVRHLRPRLSELLVFLAGRAGEVVSKEEILEQVWHRRFVAESVISRSIADLRRLLDDDAERSRYIETIPKRGYCLVAPVSAADPPSPAHAPSIVVLPFVDMTSGHGQEYLCDGLAEELTNGLARVRGLRVVARTSAFSFKGTAVDVREVARRLEVATVLEGGVQRSGDRLRITVQLIDAADGCHIWSRRFDGSACDIFAVEDEIVHAVVSTLSARLLEGGERELMQGRTSHPEAHDLYLRGRRLSARRDPGSLLDAVALFEQALAVDPGYAAAHAAIGECHAVSGFLGFAQSAEAFPAARRAAERAVALAPGLAEAHAVLGHTAGSHEWRWREAEEHFRHALDLAPGLAFARVWYSHLLTAAGRFDEAVAQCELACECDPLSPMVQTALGVALYFAGDTGRAAARFSGVLEDHPTFALAHFHLGRLQAVHGELDVAAAELEEAAPGFPMALAFLAATLHRQGRAREAGEKLDALGRLSRTSYVGPFTWSIAFTGDRKRRLEWLARAFAEHDGPIALLNVEPWMDDVRGDPVYLALQDRLGLPRVRHAPSCAGAD